MTNRHHPTLPQGYKRFSVEQVLIDTAAAIGLRGSTLHALLHMMRKTKPEHWVTPDCEPVFYAPQQDTARELGKTPRALRSTEKRLEALGLIERRVKGNGQRSSYGEAGIVFTPLIELFPRLLGMIEEIKTERAHIRTLANQRSTYLRYINTRIKDAAEQGGALAHIVAQIASWPRADALQHMPISQLEAHVEDARRLCISLEDITYLRKKTSGEPAQNFRCYIQENKQREPSVICNDNVDKQRADKSAHSEIPVSEPTGSENCLEKECEEENAARKAKMERLLQPERLFELAGEDMQAYIRDCQGDMTHLREFHFIDAASRIIHSLGINHDAWIKAVNAMGDHGAALCVLLIDANRNHPTAPIRSPGGALRAMTKRFKDNKLNIIGSLIGLARRRGVA